MTGMILIGSPYPNILATLAIDCTSADYRMYDPLISRYGLPEPFASIEQRHFLFV
jgi:hypothetical protein